MTKRAQHVGRWADRLALDRSNPRERTFAEAWESENSGYGANQTIDHLLYGHGHGAASACVPSCSEIPDVALLRPTERDRMVAATVIQWLGSNVGFCFLEDALKACGYKVVAVTEQTKTLTQTVEVQP
jgi:hypothetical protein